MPNFFDLMNRLKALSITTITVNRITIYVAAGNL